MKPKFCFLMIITVVFLAACHEQNNKLNHVDKILKIYNWEEYIGSDTIKKFTEKTGITVQIDYYKDEEEMFALIRSDLSAYDLVIASDDLVREMIIAKVLSKIDLNKIPNMKNLDKKFLNLSYDPQQEYSVPYLWGTTGMVINTEYVNVNEKSWNVLFSDKYNNKIAMLNNPFEVIAVPLKLSGNSINTTDDSILYEMEKKLIEQRKIIKGYFDALSIADMLVSEEIWAAQIYSGEGISASDKNENLLYIIPDEGAPIWMDNFVIPRDCENTESAHLFLDFILQPEINASIASELWYATANREALKFIDKEVLESESVFPDEKTLSRCEYYQNIGEATKTISEIWNRLENFNASIMSFFKKILLFMIIPGLFPIIITTIAYFVLLEPSIEQTIETGINNISISLGDEINQVINESVANTMLLAENPLIKNESSLISIKEEELRKTRDFHNIFKDISLINNNGNIIASVDYSFRGEINETLWFKKALTGKIVISDIHSLLYPYEVVLTVICPVFDQNEQIQSFIVSQLDINRIWSIVDRTALRTEAEIWLLDNKGIIIAAPDKELILEKYPEQEVYDHVRENNKIKVVSRREGNLINSFINPFNIDSENNKSQWNVIYVEENSKTYSTLTSFRIIIVIRGIVSLLLISFLSIFFSNNLSNRIRRLRDATLKLGERNYSIKVKDKGKDEVSDLIRIFSQTQKELQKSEDKYIAANERFDLAVKGAKDAIWDWDLVTDKIYFAPKWIEIIGIDKIDTFFTVDDWFNIIHLDDRERFKKKLNDHFNDKRTYFSDEYRIIRSDNTIVWIMTRGLILYDDTGGKMRMAGSHSDITDRKNMQQKVSFYAYYDSLTELPNRTKLLDRLNLALNRAIRKDDYSFCLLYLDFDGFKHINDTYGHSIGDMLLVTISQRLKDCVRPLDLVSRIGGDEFIILLDGINNNEFIESVLQRILKASREEFLLNNHSIYISVSIGIVKENDGTGNADDLIQKADIAMYYSKMNGKNKFTFFVDDLQKNEVKRWSLEHELHNALGTSALTIYYQPIIESQTNKIFSFEALLRWRHPVKGMIPPDDFIPSAEETGFISQITKWLIEEICVQARIWNENKDEDYIKISFNVTAKDFLIPGGLDHLIEETLFKNACLSQWIAMEVTERAMIKDFGTVRNQIKRIREMGISIELDDFGTGYSSLSYLNKFEIDYLKIDQSFIRSMMKDSMSLKIVKTIINLAHDLDLHIIAEGVETKEESDHLKSLGCEYFQGYYYSKPLSSQDAKTFQQNNLRI